MPSEPEVTAAKTRETLDEVMTRWAGRDEQRRATAETIQRMCNAAAEISRQIGWGPLGGPIAEEVAGENAAGDTQKTLDVTANELLLDALRNAPVAYYASEENDQVQKLDPAAPISVAVDPLDGSSNIEMNVSVGSIFSVFTTSTDGPESSLFRPGREQIAAGYFVYGPHTSLMMTVGEGTDHYVLDPKTLQFRLVERGLQVPRETKEFAINVSNYKQWHPPIRSFVDDLLEGEAGPRGKKFNMRWVASLVAEVHRIMMRGGVFLYPNDQRRGYENGRLRLIYEAAPMAFLIEQAGGGATDGTERILDKTPGELHQRTPLVIGSLTKVERVAKYYTDPSFERTQSPLFAERGLFQS
ncbi:MAG: class 1 fructose-bisphosphatase [Rhodovibrio sp.]|nr:class 1 fructose-bisphosphatase [Rhodovibrio sp.]